MEIKTNPQLTGKDYWLLDYPDWYIKKYRELELKFLENREYNWDKLREYGISPMMLRGMRGIDHVTYLLKMLEAIDWFENKWSYYTIKKLYKKKTQENYYGGKIYHGTLWQMYLVYTNQFGY